MRIAKSFTKHVFCLEGDWERDLRKKSSIGAALDFLQANCNIQYIHKHCGTKENLEYYLSRWKQKRYKEYSICYLAFHGHPEIIEVGNEHVDLKELADMLNGACVNKIIHFGSCNTLDTDSSKVREFLETTKALAVCGFRTDIDFLESSVFDMLLMQKFQEYRSIKAVDRDLKKNYNKLIQKLEFKLMFN